MENLYEFLKKKRTLLKLSLRNAADKIGISHSYLSNLEKGIDPRTGSPIKPTPETLKLIADAYELDYDSLMKLAGYLTDKEILDITKEAERMINEIETLETVEFCGTPADDEDKEFLKMAYERFLTDVRVYNKMKYTPKKHKR